MKKQDLLFYNEYEQFYCMARQSEVFHKFCEKVYGKDFSQDGFSDITQIEDILDIAQLNQGSTVLDIGCGNGKMLKFICEKSEACGYGFDYSNNAIESAQNMANGKDLVLHFQTGLIGEINYDKNMFDLITSIDSIYFAENMSKFVQQIYSWLKPNGIFICAYQEGDMMKKSKNENTTELALVLKKLEISYKVTDYTKRTYDLLRHKRKIIEEMKDEFIKNNMKIWYKCAIHQSCAESVSYEQFANNNSRYSYIIRKQDVLCV